MTSLLQENEINGFNLVIEALKKNKITEIYGVAGIPVTDLMRLAQEHEIKYYGFRHETSAGFAAAISGYLQQWPGICMTVSAPGFLNGMVALANATTNGFPMILISGSSNRAITDLKQGDYEELDQMNAAAPYAKAVYRINRVEDIGLSIARAIRCSLSGRPGGVYIDLPAALLPAAMPLESGIASIISVTDPAPAQFPSEHMVQKALDLLRSAKRPIVVVGKGAAYARVENELTTFLEEASLPFLPMSMAKGLLPDSHPQSSATARSFVLGEADVVMLIGARFNWLLSHGKAPLWSETAKIIQLEIDPGEIDCSRRIDVPVVGDIISTMTLFLKYFARQPFSTPTEWIAEIGARKKANTDKMASRSATVSAPMNFYTALSTVNKVMQAFPDAYLVSEGANTLDVGRNLIDMKKPRHRLDSGTWGTMGIGMGYAIAAAVTQKSPVVALEGDSAFGFSGMDVETICRYALPVTIIVMNNGGIYRGDDINRSSGSEPGVTTLMASARYDLVIEAFGGTGYYATTPVELETQLNRAITSGKPALINVVIDIHAGTESGHLQKLNTTSDK